MKQDFSGYSEERAEGIVKRSFIGPKPPPVTRAPRPRTVHRYRIRANANVFGGWDITMRVERWVGDDYTFCLHPNDTPQALFDEVSHNEWPIARAQPSCEVVAPPEVLSRAPEVKAPREADLILKAPEAASRKIEYVSVVIRKLTVYHIVDPARTQEANDWRLVERNEGKPAVKVARCGYQQEYPLTYDASYVARDVSRQRAGYVVKICGRCR